MIPVLRRAHFGFTKGLADGFLQSLCFFPSPLFFDLEPVSALLLLALAAWLANQPAARFNKGNARYIIYHGHGKTGSFSSSNPKFIEVAMLMRNMMINFNFGLIAPFLDPKKGRANSVGHWSMLLSLRLAHQNTVPPTNLQHQGQLHVVFKPLPYVYRWIAR